MAFKSLKSHITNLATPFLNDIASNFLNAGSQKDAGKFVAAVLDKKGPFEIGEAPDQKVRKNPLSFRPVQYPLDLGTNELGHYILFESGFVGYSPQTDSFLAKSSDIGGSAPKITAKTPSHSITTSGIALYMPAGIKVSYNQSYDADTETGLVGQGEATLSAVGSAESKKQALEAALQGIVGGTATKAKEILGQFVSLAGAGDPVRFAAKRAGVAVNPRNEAFYNSPQQRTFSFTFDFWPRNPEEADAVSQIVSIFKYNSAPGFKAGTLGALFENPNYWRISYMFNNGENPHLNKIGACYCTDVEVDYSPDGQWTTFKTGQPVHTKLTVNMLEDRIITKQEIEAGA